MVLPVDKVVVSMTNLMTIEDRLDPRYISVDIDVRDTSCRASKGFCRGLGIGLKEQDVEDGV